MSELYPAVISITLSAGIFLMVYAVLGTRRRVDPWERMNIHTPNRYAQAQGEKKERRSPLGALLNRRMAGSGYGDKIAKKLVQADVRLTPGEYVAARIAAATGGVLVGLLLALRMGVPSYLVAGVCAFVGYKIPAFVVGRKRKKRVAAFNGQLADSTMMLSSSLRAGYSLLQSMDLLSRDAPNPTSVEFRRIVQEVGVGLSLSEALANLHRRVPSNDLDLLITAVGIQQEVGGNLSQILEQIAETIRERVRIKGEVKVLTSQGKYSGYIITALPLIMAGAMYVMNPKYMEPFWSFPWMCMPIASLLMIGLAYFIISKIVNIEV